MPNLRRFSPFILLLIGAGLIGLAVWQYQASRNSSTRSDGGLGNVNRTAGSGSCGDGICQNVACLSTACPDPETPDSCPEDCAATDDGSSATTDLGEVNADESGNTNDENTNVAALNFTFATQSLQDKEQCPVEEANMTPADVVDVAQSEGLTQGTKALAVRLYEQSAPLQQCVWSVRNQTSASGGDEYLVIDATQEVYQKKTWQGGTL